jgi:hypothetical protein
MITTFPTTGKKPNNPPKSPGEALERWRNNPNVRHCVVEQARQMAKQGWRGWSIADYPFNEVEQVILAGQLKAEAEAELVRQEQARKAEERARKAEELARQAAEAYAAKLKKIEEAGYTRVYVNIPITLTVCAEADCDAVRAKGTDAFETNIKGFIDAWTEVSGANHGTVVDRDDAPSSMLSRIDFTYDYRIVMKFPIADDFEFTEEQQEAIITRFIREKVDAFDFDKISNTASKWVIFEYDEQKGIEGDFDSWTIERGINSLYPEMLLTV